MTNAMLETLLARYLGKFLKARSFTKHFRYLKWRNPGTLEGHFGCGFSLHTACIGEDSYIFRYLKFLVKKCFGRRKVVVVEEMMGWAPGSQQNDHFLSE